MSDKKETKNELIAGVEIDAIELLEQAAEKYSMSAIENAGPFKKMLLLAEGIKVLTDLVTDDMMARIMFLQSNPMGFRTDKDPTKKEPNQTGYDIKTVKRIFIEATLRSLPPVGNMFNVIAGNLYITKEGFKNILRKLPGFTDLKYNLGIPRVDHGKTVVDFDATWRYHGRPGDMAGSIPITTNAYSTPDAVLGKTERKLLYRIHAEVTGSQISEFEERDASEFQTQTTKSPVGQRAAQATKPKSIEAPAAEVKGEATKGEPDAKQATNGK